MLAPIGLAVLVGLAVGLAISWGLAASKSRALRAMASAVTEEIEPYLRRRAAEIGMDPARPVWTIRHTPKERVGYSVGLAQKLLKDARGEDPGHSSTALAQTSPAIDSGAVTAPHSIKADIGKRDV